MDKEKVKLIQKLANRRDELLRIINGTRLLYIEEGKRAENSYTISFSHEMNTEDVKNFHKTLLAWESDRLAFKLGDFSTELENIEVQINNI